MVEEIQYANSIDGNIKERQYVRLNICTNDKYYAVLNRNFYMCKQCIYFYYVNGFLIKFNGCTFIQIFNLEKKCIQI